MKSVFACLAAAVVVCGWWTGIQAQEKAAQTPSDSHPAPSDRARATAGVPLPPGYVIGADDVLSVVFWRDKDMSTEVVVRPDGKISVPLLNDIQAAGQTPDQLRAYLESAATKYLAEPNASVIVKAINSRKVYITGQVAKPGSYPLTTDMNVLQLIAHVGGLLEYANSENIVVLRIENGQEQRLKFNYKDVVKGKTQQNVILKPGDTIIVP